MITASYFGPACKTGAQAVRQGNALRIPPEWDGGNLRAAPEILEIWPGFRTPVLAFNGSVPSPTIRVQQGQEFAARIENRLTDNLVVHWHGIIAPPAMDGHPRDAVSPGQNYTVKFPIHQPAGTYFYHPHTEPLTGKLVYSGLAGALIVENAAEKALGLPTDTHDVPLLIQDKRSNPNRQLTYELSMMDTMSGFLGDVVLVNGTPDAYLSVDKSIYRLRLVNGSNARVYKIGFSDGRAFQVIATDGGLLAEPLSARSAYLAPGQRLEILADFSNDVLGASVVLQSQHFMPGGMMMMMMSGQGVEMDILKFFVDRPEKGSGIRPATLSPLSRLNPAEAKRNRVFTLQMAGMSHVINGARYKVDRVDFSVPFGELEIWEFQNQTDELHPMHPHAALFQVLDRNRNSELAPEDTGWKDTVLVFPNETVRILIRFDSYAGLFVSHCHNLEHEDDGMMQNFQVLPPASIPLQIERNGPMVLISYSVPDAILESASSLNPPIEWKRVSEPPMIVGERRTVMIMELSGSQFYRLRRPGDPSI